MVSILIFNFFGGHVDIFFNVFIFKRINIESGKDI